MPEPIPAVTTVHFPTEAVFALRQFKHENSPNWANVPAPDPGDPEPSDEEMRRLLTFAGRALGDGDPTVPRHLEAHRVLSLVPEHLGGQLFGVPAPDSSEATRG